MDDLKQKLKALVKGEVEDSSEILDKYSHDASMFELKPQVIVYPKDDSDISKVIDFVATNKKQYKDLSVTIRSAGTDMSGGAINDSILIDMTKYFTKTGKVTGDQVWVQPGVYYRDFEPKTLESGLFMPSYPASRDLCTVGGMVANNAGGERSLEYGKTEKFVNELKVTFADGKNYTVKPLDHKQLVLKMAQKDFEGQIYRQTFDLINKHYDLIMSSKPNVSKDSTGYHLWNVYDKKSGIFDLTQIIVGSQGTLGVVTDINFRLVKAPQYSGTLVIFLRSINDLGKLINKVLVHKPATFEGFDNYTLMLSFKLFYFFHKTIGWLETIKLAIQLIPNAIMLLRGIPKMILLVEFDGDSPEEVKQRVHNLKLDLKEFNHEALFEEDNSEAKSKKFWIMRRQSFNILRSKVKDKHTAPFMDDLVVPPKYLPYFLPKVRKIINKYGLLATIAGHMGDGNFHIIPLMKIENPEEKAKLEPALIEVNDLVLKYGGSLSGEHNDGLIRGPWLETMYGKKMYHVLKETKHIFDPENIFNPHKKTDAKWSYSMDHLREHF